MLPDNIPEALRKRPRWVLWNYVWSEDKQKWDKPPKQASGRHASTTAPRTWDTFHNVLAAYNAGGWLGIGYCMAPRKPTQTNLRLVGIDLDNVRDPATGVIDKWARDVVRRLGTYTEVSPSGCGLRIFCYGTLPPEGRKKGDVEVYVSGRYLTITGQHLPGTPTDIHEREVELHAFHRKHFGTKAPSAPQNAPGRPDGPQVNGTGADATTGLSDAEIIERACRARNRDKFCRLWGGDASDYLSNSEADLALVTLLAFWTQDPEQLDRLYRQSGLYRDRDKWDREDYRARTIRKALATMTATYAPERNGTAVRPATNGRRRKDHEVQAPADAPVGSTDAPAEGAERTGAEVILDYFRRRYDPLFRRGNAIYCRDGREVGMSEATGVADSALIRQLEGATDAPHYKGGAVNRNGLPGFFRTWSRISWGDLLATLPTEDEADLGATAPARDEFRRLVAEALHSEVTFADTVKKFAAPSAERRSLIAWCAKFAKHGPWRGIRSKRIWCRRRHHPDGQEELQVALRAELFAQLQNVDPRLRQMGENLFARRCARYGVGRSGGRDQRVHGVAAVILDPDFVREMTATLPDNLAAESEAETES